MGVPPVILHLLITSYFLLVTSQSTQNLTQSTAPTLSKSTIVAVEGGPIPLPPTDSTQSNHMIKINHTQVPPNEPNHSDREHMIKVDHTQNATKFPPYEVGQKNDNKTSVPKKDAILHSNTSIGSSSTSSSSTSSSSSTTSSSTTSTSTTTTTPAPHKPTVTIGEDEEPQRSNPKTKLNDTSKHGINIESVTERTKKTDYVVPIVAVILSVPLVAILFSVLYKRGADWWQHRHYRRMDFLIEGMYNN